MSENKQYIYFFDDFNDIRKYKEGTDNDFAEVISILDLIEDANRLSDENKELKKDNDKLISETANIIAEHQRRVFDLIDTKINKLQQRYDFGRKHNFGPMYSLRVGINILKDLKKELQK